MPTVLPVLNLKSHLHPIYRGRWPQLFRLAPRLGKAIGRLRKSWRNARSNGRNIALAFVSMNKFTVRYPNGIKRHINKRELDLLGASLNKIGPKEYSAASLVSDLKEATGPNFLDLELVFERKGKQRDHEREQTPRGMIARLEQMGFIAESLPVAGFEAAA